MTGIGIFQDYYLTHQLKDYSSSEVAWIPSTESFMMFFWVCQLLSFSDVHTNSRDRDQSFGEDVGGGDPDDVAAGGRRRCQAGLDVVVRPAGQGPCPSDEVGCVGLLGDDHSELGPGLDRPQRRGNSLGQPWASGDDLGAGQGGLVVGDLAIRSADLRGRARQRLLEAGARGSEVAPAAGQVAPGAACFGDRGDQAVRGLEDAGGGGRVDEHHAGAGDESLGTGDEQDVGRLKVAGQRAVGLDVQLARACARRPGSSTGRIASPASVWANRSVR